MLVALANQLISIGSVADAIDAATRALRLESTSGAALRAVMRSRALAGDRTAALQAHREFVRRLDEVGAVPDYETEQLAELVRHERVWSLPDEVTAAGRSAGESRRVPLVGRGEELKLVMESWAGCRSGQGAGAVLVAGDTGTGKTRFVEEVAGRARLDGATIVAVRAVEADASEEWSGLLAMARGGLLEAPGLAGADPAAISAFSRRVPEWLERFRDTGTVADELPLGHALSEVVRVLTDERPLLITADDVHWLDRPSLLALAALLRDHPKAPLAVLLTYSPNQQSAELDDIRARIGRDISGASVALTCLSEDLIRDLARWALPSYGEEELDRVSRRVCLDSAGLPLLAVELLHAVALGMELSEVSGAAWPKPLHTLDETLPGDLPDAVVAAVRVGFRRLTKNAQQLLAIASVMKERVAPREFERVAGLSGAALAEALDELEWQRWLTAEARGYTFVARIVKDVVARDMVTPGQRQRISEMLSASG